MKPLVNFRADPVLIAALSQAANDAGCTVSEYLRGIVRERVAH